jgi:hypothetical protein
MTTRGIAWLMTFVAATLAVASTIHLTGGHDDAGIPEAAIAVVLVAGVLALRRGIRRIAVAAVVFAIAGFGIGITETVRGGATTDIAYHATMLPLLVLTLAELVRSRIRAL